MTSAIEIHAHLQELQAERALAWVEGLAVKSGGRPHFTAGPADAGSRLASAHSPA